MSQKQVKAGLSKANVNAIAGAIGTATLNRLVPIFSTSVAYTKGQYTNYNNQLYRFTADKSAGAWDSSKVESASLNDLIHDVNEAVASVTGKANTVDLETGRLVPAKSQVAQSLETSLGKLDKTPFAYQSSGGKTDIETGTQETLKLVGATIIKNQLVNLTNTSSTSWGDGAGTYSISNGVITVNVNTAGSTVSKVVKQLNIPLKAGHKCLCVVNGTFSSKLFLYDNSNNQFLSFNEIKTISVSGYYNLLYYSSGGVAEAETYSFTLKVFDLTQMFGSNDVVDAIIGNVAENQISNLMKFTGGWLPTAYDTGTRVPSKTAYIKSDGYNVWDEEWEVGSLDNDGNNSVANDRIRAKNWIRVKPNTVYYIKSPQNVFFRWKDANGNPIENTIQATHDGVITTPLNASYLRFGLWDAYGTTYNNDICIFEYWDGSRIGYEPHEEVIEPMPNVELDGILKVDESGNVYADGDELYSDGEGNKKRYGIVDLSQRQDNLSFNAGFNCWILGGTYPRAKYVDINTKPNIIDNLGTPAVRYYGDKTNALSVADNGYLLIGNGSSTTKPTQTIIYELAEEQPLEANDFNPNLWADDFGHLQCQDEDHNEIVGLQGVEILYKANVAGFAESLYERTGGEPSDVVIQEDLAGLVAQEDVANKITLSSGITGVYKKAYKTGKVVNLSLILKNETGDALTSLATLFTLDSSLYPANQYIVDYVESNNVLKRFRINPSGEGGVEDALVNNGVVYINISYCL